MKPAACERAWQVEAARDGRLDAHACAALAPHLTACPTCRLEQHRLEQLALGLSAIGHEVDEMALRRLRQRTLERANAVVTQSGATRRWPRVLSWTLAACISAAAAAFVLGPALAPRQGARSSAVVVVAAHDAKWQRNIERDVERVDLSAGTLLFRVARKPTDPRLIVRVPDGVIEDLGTTFSVSVRDDKTSEIAVREGHVLFHRRGAPALHLVAGSTWTPPPEPRPLPATAIQSPPVPSGEGTGAAAPDKPRPHERHTPPATSASRATAQAATDAAASESAEDQAYLHVVALLREGRSAEARLAAFAYLKAFPSGFRRVEVNRVASSSTAQGENE